MDIVAKGPEDASIEQVQMIRTLLVDRFRLQIRTEVRQRPVYELRVARENQFGPNLRPSQHDCRAFKAMGGSRNGPDDPLDAHGRPACWPPLGYVGGVSAVRDAGPIGELVLRLQGAVDRPVVDATGLMGLYEWDLIYGPPQTIASTAREGTLSASEIFTAIREQLGLELKAATGPVETVVIESVSPEPTPN